MSLAKLIAEEYKSAEQKTAVIVCGPTASGKSSLAMELCGLLNGELISCDSMQIYRMMDIGTAKPSVRDRELVPHHMIDITDPWENYSAFMYKNDAVKAISEVFSRSKVPVICGGTGLYVNALIDNREYSCEPDNAFFSEEFRAEKKKCDCCLEKGDRASLHDMLKKYDPEAAAEIHMNNVKRVYRALYLYFVTGKVRAQRNLESTANSPEFGFNVYCLMPRREELYERINSRVDIMREEGLAEEADRVYAACREKIPAEEVSDLRILKRTALSAIGYKELIPLLDYPELAPVKEDLPYDAVSVFEKIKQDTRQYAKRQLTWFKKTPGARFLEC